MKSIDVNGGAALAGEDRRRTVSLGGVLSALIWEGAWANIFVVLTGGAFLTGMAIFLGASDFELGVLAAVPFLMQSAQLLSPFVFRNPVAAKNGIVATLAVSRMLWLAIIPLLLLSGEWRLQALIAIVLVSGLLTMLSSPAWLSWMAAVVPDRLRGRFFSRRNVAVAATTVIGTIVASLLLDWLRERQAEALGFGATVLLASAGASAAWFVMFKAPNARRTKSDNAQHRVNLLIPFRDRSFRRVMTVFAVWNIAIGLSAAFFAPHMLLNLKMSFFQIGLYSCVAALVAILFSRAWGRLIDRFGSRPVLNVCAYGIALIPLVWLFPRADSLWILIPEVIYSGMLWAGFNLAAFTLPLDKSPRADRTVYLSVFAAVTGLAFFMASIAAGFLAEQLTDWSYEIGSLTFVNYHVLFTLSALLRLLTAGLVAVYHEPSEVRFPIMIQLMGYAVLRRVSLGRQVWPFAAEGASSEEHE